MSGNDNNPTTVTDTAPKPVSRFRQISLLAGLLLALAGVFLLGDTASRLELALGFIGHWWAWALLGLAAVNIAMSVFRLESLLAPGLLAFIAAVGLAIQHGVATTLLLNFVFPVVLSLTGIAILTSTRKPADRSWTRVLFTGRVHAPTRIHAILRPKAIFGEIKANLRPLGSSPLDDVEVHVTAIFGHVRLDVPAEWNIKATGTGKVLTPVRDPMPNGTGIEIRMRVLGFCGVVTVVRT